SRPFGVGGAFPAEPAPTSDAAPSPTRRTVVRRFMPSPNLRRARYETIKVRLAFRAAADDNVDLRAVRPGGAEARLGGNRPPPRDALRANAADEAEAAASPSEQSPHRSQGLPANAANAADAERVRQHGDEVAPVVHRGEIGPAVSVEIADRKVT